MRRAVLLALLALTACSKPAKEPEAPFAFAATSITLPAETAALPASPAADRVTVACTACHSADMIVRQPPLKPEQWAATVKKMREVYKATYPESEDAGLVAALIELQSPDAP
ncbi:cytochrome C nitrite reductase [Sphingomonas sp. SUN019]|uniref:cytochrome C nitrite reductase n=1 Tax=Sphingomonas sp. SUN019 TaxID=2937788 RepID=UPI002164D5BA|nr:cytochrome C nitrite reductase [Sphingomonas sp. SUN019]UVO50948.1 cytochrome C nitrite reductase [Sphingomonas sp. SUN019]